MASEDVIARLVVQGQAQFSQAMGGASRQARTVGTEQEQAGKKAGVSAGGLLKAAAAAGALYKGYGFLKDSISTTINLAKSTAAFSRASGLDQKASQAWVVTAQQRNIDTKQLQMGMATLGRNLGGLGTATKASGAAFQKLGLDQQALIKMPMEQRMSSLADAFAKLPDGVDKAALAQKLFGRSGQALLPLLNSGSKALNAQLDAAGRLVPVNENASKSALELAKQQRELGMAMTGIKTAIGSALVPILSTFARILVPIISSITQLMATSTAFRVVVYALAAAIGVLTIAMLANPVGLIAAGVVALAAAFAVAYQKVGWFRSAIDAVAGALSTAFMAAVNAVGAAIGFVASNWKIFATVLLVALGPIGLVVAAFINFRSQIMSAISAVISAVGKLPGAIGKAAKSAVSALTGAFSGAVGKMGQIGTQIVNAIVNAIKAGAGAVLSAAKSIIPDPGEIAGGLISGIKSIIPGMKTGGIFAAQGGGVTGSRVSLIGERGPELANFPAGTRITPLPPPSLLPSQLTGGGGSDIVIPVYLDRRQIALAMASEAAEQKARR
jgi:hypothetical protein